MLFNYKAIDTTGVPREGAIDAINVDIAINSLQRRGLSVSSIKAEEKESFLTKKFTFLERVSNKDIVILSRQLSTLFEAQISALRIFRLLGSETSNHLLSVTLNAVADDLQGGSSISNALSKHPKVFSSFYINMVKAGEESGKLNDVFMYLADYMDRTYEVTSKAKNALIYPAFVVFTFVAVMSLMLTVVIPKISQIIVDSGQDIPLYTQIVLSISDFFVAYGLIFLVAVIVGFFFFIKYIHTREGRFQFDKFKLTIPYLGTLYKKVYLSRIADNLNTMLVSAIPILKALEITSDVVGNAYYETILKQIAEDVKGGNSLSSAFEKYEEIPGILIQMIKVGEESGELDHLYKNARHLFIFFKS